MNASTLDERVGCQQVVVQQHVAVGRTHDNENGIALCVASDVLMKRLFADGARVAFREKFEQTGVGFRPFVQRGDNGVAAGG